MYYSITMTSLNDLYFHSCNHDVLSLETAILHFKTLSKNVLLFRTILPVTRPAAPSAVRIFTEDLRFKMKLTDVVILLTLLLCDWNRKWFFIRLWFWFWSICSSRVWPTYRSSGLRCLSVQTQTLSGLKTQGENVTLTSWPFELFSLLVSTVLWVTGVRFPEGTD